MLAQLAAGKWCDNMQAPQLLKSNLADLTAWRVVPTATAQKIWECFFPPTVSPLLLLWPDLHGLLCYAVLYFHLLYDVSTSVAAS